MVCGTCTGCPTRGRAPGRAAGAGAGAGAGLSVLELLCVLVVLGLLAALSLPPWSRWRARVAVSSARDAFAMLHARARLAALRYGRVARLHLDDERGRAWVVVDASDRPDGGGGTVPVAAAVDFPAEFAGVALTSNRRSLCFGPRGLPVAGDGCDLPNATIAFRLGSVADTVTISVAGRLLKR